MLDVSGCLGRARDLGLAASTPGARHLFVAAATGLALLATASKPAAAQGASTSTVSEPHKKRVKSSRAASDAAVQVEGITVTASRTGRESIQNLPSAITALNPRTLDTLQLTSLTEIGRLAPSLNVVDEGPGISSVTIRGLAVRGIDTSETEDRPLVQTYLDDTALSVKSANPDLKVVDLEDVEVLRGPQGTLYGAGSMAGTIRLVTQKPDPNSLFGYAEATGSGTAGYGGFNDNGRFMINVPLVAQKLAIRISGYHDDYSGYIKDVATGIRDVATGATTNPETSNQLRVALRWTPTDRLTVDFSVTQEIEHGGLNYARSELPKYETDVPTQTRSDQDLLLYALTLRYELPHLTITSATSYTLFRTRYDEDESAANYDFLFGNEGTEEPASFIARNMVENWDEELRFTTRDTGPLKATAGIYYQTGTRDTSEEDPTAGIDAVYGESIGIPDYNSRTNDLASEANDYYSGLIHSLNRQVALFAEGTYTVRHKLDLTAGLRFFDWSERYSIATSGLGGSQPPASEADPVGTPITQGAHIAASGVTPRFAALYHVTPKLNLWAEVAKGFRYGGANQPIPTSYCGADLAAHGLQAGPLGFGPDKLWSYSLGEKSTLLNGRVTLNLTAFWINWYDTQTTTYLNCTYYYTTNAGNITSRGIELDSTLQLLPGLRLLVNGSYNDAYAADPISSLNAPAGTRAPFAPVWIASATGTYDHDVGGHDLQLTLNYSYKSNFTNELDHTDSAFRVIPGSQSLNAALTYYLHQFEVSVFADNITNEYAINYIQAQPSGAIQPGDDLSVTRPRTVGMRVRASF